MADVFLKIEDEILSVPRASLAISEVFEDMFQMPQPSGEGTADAEGLEGSSKNNPIVLEGEKIAEWRSLVKLLVPLTTEGIVPAELELDICDWQDSLKLAKKYNMEPVHSPSSTDI
ncbi:hypothetical protein DFP72DRAFT_1071863 [Ephemerocybe angulata]|uniref:BTB domain-containing protein n=1 Tax=Ephemerocybe angulata TaxID=980116 RepID=A0A8H6HSI9_9AGAR|nr:hypothetical protein DFP72DRAFT_1071863 [Tulosesus angulatus]